MDDALRVFMFGGVRSWLNVIEKDVVERGTSRGNGGNIDRVCCVLGMVLPNGIDDNRFVFRTCDVVVGDDDDDDVEIDDVDAVDND